MGHIWRSNGRTKFDEKPKNRKDNKIFVERDSITIVSKPRQYCDLLPELSQWKLNLIMRNWTIFTKSPTLNRIHYFLKWIRRERSLDSKHYISIIPKLSVFRPDMIYQIWMSNRVKTIWNPKKVQSGTRTGTRTRILLKMPSAENRFLKTVFLEHESLYEKYVK